MVVDNADVLPDESVEAFTEVDCPEGDFDVVVGDALEVLVFGFVVTADEDTCFADVVGGEFVVVRTVALEVRRDVPAAVVAFGTVLVFPALVLTGRVEDAKVTTLRLDVVDPDTLMKVKDFSMAAIRLAMNEYKVQRPRATSNLTPTQRLSEVHAARHWLTLTTVLLRNVLKITLSGPGSVPS